MQAGEGRLVAYGGHVLASGLQMESDRPNLALLGRFLSVPSIASFIYRPQQPKQA
jgi:hypothetical protein